MEHVCNFEGGKIVNSQKFDGSTKVCKFSKIHKALQLKGVNAFQIKSQRCTFEGCTETDILICIDIDQFTNMIDQKKFIDTSMESIESLESQLQAIENSAKTTQDLIDKAYDIISKSK